MKTIRKGPGRRHAAPPLSSRLSAAAAVAVAASVALTLLCGEAPAADKSYYHPEIEIRFRLQPDGSAAVEETRSFAFDGEFSWAQYDKKKSGRYGRYGIRFSGVWDAESGRELRSETTSSPGSEIIKWYYSARNETKRFLIRYTIRDAVQRYSDAAQFYFKALGDSHEPVSMVRIEIIPPGISESLFKVFVHGRARPGVLNILEDRSAAKITQQSIPRNAFVEVRALMDPSIFHLADIRPGETHETLLEDERKTTEAWRLAEQRMIEARLLRMERLKRSALIAAAFLAVFLAVYFWFFFRFGKELSVDYDEIYEREPPRDIPPYMVPAILSQSSVQIPEMAKGFAATLLEAARLGYLEISETEEKSLIFKKKYLIYTATEKGLQLLGGGSPGLGRGERELARFEIDVLRTVFKEAGDGSSVTSDEIEKWAAKTSGGRTRYYKFIKRRAKEVRKKFEREYFRLDDPVSEKARGGFIAVSAASGVILAASLFIYSKHPLAIFYGVIILIAGTLMSIPLARRTKEAAVEHKRWMAFKKFMSDFSAMKEAGPSLLPMWEHYLVYATALGVADKLLSNLKLVAAEYGAPVQAALWYHPAVAGSSLQAQQMDGLASLESLSSSISNLQGLSSALSSSSGGGGGFSGGGGGGGGGGGCSAG